MQFDAIPEEERLEPLSVANLESETVGLFERCDDLSVDVTAYREPDLRPPASEACAKTA